jgi:hypothetical protein
MERTLTARELNRALLARQGLLERRELTIPDALDAMGALQRARIFNTKMPQSVVDGAVAGAWRPDGTIEPFEPLTKAQRKAVDAEAARLAAFCA